MGRVICELDFRTCGDCDFDEKEKEGTDVDGIDQEDTERHEYVLIYSHVLWQCEGPGVA